MASGKGAGIFKIAQSFFRFLKTDAHVAGDAAHARPRFKLKSMREEYRYEHIPGHPQNKWNPSHVMHLNDAQREQLRLTVGHDGRLYDSKGMPFDTRNGMSVHTRGGGRAIFVMDEHGTVYASNYQEVGRFHHSSFLGGRPVAGAGELQVHNGNIMAISRQSGHYRPEVEHLQQVVDQLRGNGALFGNHHIEWGV